MRRLPVAVLVLLLCAPRSTNAQATLTPTVIATSGGSATVGGLRVDQTIGEPVISTLDAGGMRLTQGFHQADPVRLHLNIRAFLQGPYNSGSGLMIDSLRTRGYLPMIEPYTALGYTQIGGGGETTSASVLAVSGGNAVVDWIFLELRDKADNTHVLATRCGLLQADGDIMAADGTSAVSFSAPNDLYYICVKHRNHLGILTSAAVPLSSTATSVDLSDGSTATFGTDAQTTIGTVRLLWAGDVTASRVIKYTGSFNDREPILQSIGGVVPTNTTDGYGSTDVNLDGTTKYTGANNDREIILQNIGGVVPTNVRSAQLP